MGWYGPLIDLSRASSHIGDYVQLLVFLHKSAPVQYKLSNGAEIIRTDIQVGDDTRPFFSVSIWKKEMASMASSGCIVLLQNVRITKFQEIIEARTVQCSSLQCLVHPEELKVLKGVNDIKGSCRAGVQTKEKLRKVIEWVHRAGSGVHNAASQIYQVNKILGSRSHKSDKTQMTHTINWRVQEVVSQDCFSLLQVLRLSHSCKATFLASIGELFISLNSSLIKEIEEDRMFISRRLCITGDKNLAEDLICNGCQLCGSPLDSQSRSKTEQSTLALYCQNNSKHLHKISAIYRPFMLYVWDDSNCIPLLVKNKAAESLFGNLKAETVKSSFVSQVIKDKSNLNANKSTDDPNIYLIWLVLVKVLLQQGRNSPLRFKVEVNVDREIDAGRFELVSLCIPCFGTEP